MLRSILKRLGLIKAPKKLLEKTRRAIEENPETRIMKVSNNKQENNE
jgi:hypothetical protein